MNKPLQTRHGFTLIECLIVLAVISISLMVSTPVFSVLEKYRIESNARDVSNAVMYARLLAIKDKKSVFVCPSKDKLSCDRAWAKSILVYRNNNDDKAFEIGDELIHIFDLGNASSLVRWSSFRRKDYLELLASGMTNYQNGTFTVCAESKSPSTAIPVIINVAGRTYYGRDRNKDGIREFSSGQAVHCN